MAEQDARGALAVVRQEGVEEGHKSGVAEGKRDTLFRLLARTGIALSEDDRARIQACEEALTLDRWYRQCLGVEDRYRCAFMARPNKLRNVRNVGRS